MKALVLYPMNALASDQAQRIANAITTAKRLATLTAAVDTGETKDGRTTVTTDGLITGRAIIRDTTHTPSFSSSSLDRDARAIVVTSDPNIPLSTMREP